MNSANLNGFQFVVNGQSKPLNDFEIVNIQVCWLLFVLLANIELFNSLDFSCFRVNYLVMEWRNNCQRLFSLHITMHMDLHL